MGKPSPAPKPEMNLILLQLLDFIERVAAEGGGSVTGIVELTDHRRVEHVMKTLHGEVGSMLKCGEADGLIGTGEVVEIKAPEEGGKSHSVKGRKIEPCPTLVIKVTLDQPPPPPSPVTVGIALCRAKSFPKILETLTVLGVKRIFILNTERVEPGYWHTHTLQPDELRKTLTLGLEQTVDTTYPVVTVCKKLDWFIEKQVPALVAASKINLIAHPDETGVSCPRGVTEPCNLLIGPEGGFIDPEVDRFRALGFTCVTLGTRILPVQTAVHYLLGKLGDE